MDAKRIRYGRSMRKVIGYLQENGAVHAIDASKALKLTATNTCQILRRLQVNGLAYIERYTWLPTKGAYGRFAAIWRLGHSDVNLNLREWIKEHGEREKELRETTDYFYLPRNVGKRVGDSVLNALRDKGPMRTVELAKLLGAKHNTVWRALRRLQTEKQISYTGTKTHPKWFALSNHRGQLLPYQIEKLTAIDKAIDTMREQKKRDSGTHIFLHTLGIAK